MDSPLIESEGGWELPVQGWRVTRCFVDHAAFGLLVDGGTGEILRLYLETAFTLTDAGEAETFGGTDANPTDYAPLLRLMGRTVERVGISRSGDMTIELDAESKIDVPPNPDYEAWQLDGLGRLMIVCTPGGGEPTIFNG